MKNLLKKCGELSKHPFTLVAIEKNDQPLVYVNQAFRNLVQYEDKEILGRNCRFLQGKLTDSQSVRRIREAILARDPLCEDLVNYRKDGTYFWNRLVLLPIQIKGETFYFGMQHDVSEKKRDSSALSKKANPHEVSDWIKNRLNAVILNIEMLDKRPDIELITKIVQILQKISYYIYSLP